MILPTSCALFASCIALAGALDGKPAVAQAGDGTVRHCRNLHFSERLRAYGTGCSEARRVARRAARHIAYDAESGWRVDAQVRSGGRLWNCAGAGFNPLPLACRHSQTWIRLQIWAD